MKKIVINCCYGGFGLSKKARALYKELSGRSDFFDHQILRDDPNLVKVVEQLGEEANTGASALEVIEIPDNVKWHIDEYDGVESIHEDHRVWG